MKYAVNDTYIAVNRAIDAPNESPILVNRIPDAICQKQRDKLKLIDCVDVEQGNKAQSCTQQVNKKRVAEHFSAACYSYDQYAQVQKQIAEVNFELLADLVSGRSKYSVDLGCGTGSHTSALAKMADNCLAIDISHGMLKAAQMNNAERATAANKAILYCSGDADSLPLQSHSIDALHSSMALQWCSSPSNAIAEIVRVLSTSGCAQLAIMLDSSLYELRQAWQHIGLAPRVNEFFSQKQWLDATQDLKTDEVSSSADAQIDIQQQICSFTEWHQSSLQMLRALKRVGAATKSNDTQTDENSHSPTSSAISRQELLELDEQMRQQLQAANEQSPQVKTGGKDESSLGFPLTYQILFLSIKKTQSER
jgi:malonyl-CoA O-methyltransferase